ncbi:hypothetical protein [Branchiibius sp. NY16-3462-2]|uniref:SbtR family transcriptional regulator n=1 Tax=Branchiibius sp. NY16-3462-2 TaxID=1807500 RepID=UPI00079B2947|nr:hypothetical protein [Branchiibius sp. NY16-3462-2]KYH43507.1 hypothetical protein AZH51_17315 [Branchiibius sp. NY16-3462-2]
MATKQGLAAALHSGDTAYESLAQAFSTTLVPTLDQLLTSARAAGEPIAAVDPNEFLSAVVNLCQGPGGAQSERAERMVRLLLAGLRAG